MCQHHGACPRFSAPHSFDGLPNEEVTCVEAACDAAGDGTPVAVPIETR